MQTVGIITLHTPVNYGSCLQTFATSEFVRLHGFEPVIIDYKYPTRYHKELQQKYNASHPKRTIFQKILSVIGGFFVKKLHNSQKDEIEKFFAKHIVRTKAYETSESLEKDPPYFDMYVTGSDQVWNPKFMGTDTTYLQTWVPPKSKKISYASSVSLKVFPEEISKLYSNPLSDFDFLSTRENPEIISKLTQKKCVETLDPTFLLSHAEWVKYMEEEAIVSGKYILCYLLGYMFNPYPYIYQLIERVKKLTGYKVVIIKGKPEDTLRGYTIINDGSPTDFLNLFHNASFVITTSFHGSVFAINFGKFFFSVINDCDTLDNRQYSLVQNFGIENKVIIKNNTNVDEINLPDYSIDDTMVVLEKLRHKSIEYFETALNSRISKW